jgi:glycosyltransferase involved in cell wall biosynthesis
MATYNGERFLVEQLNSVLEQTYAHIEIIVIDDCSSDNTLSMLNKYAEEYSNMKLYENEKNIGHIKTFEKGILLSHGQYISLCDQDDIWDKRKIEILMNEIKSYGMVFCDSTFINEEGTSLNKKLSDIKNLATYNNCEPFIIGNCISGHAAIFTREIASFGIPFPPEIIHDWWLAFIATSRGMVPFVNQALVGYRQHSSNFIGAINVKGGRKKDTKHATLDIIRRRVKLFYEKCPDKNLQSKQLLQNVCKSYSDFSIQNNFLRMTTFFRNKSNLLAIKKRTPFRKWLFCFKMFFKII